MPAERLQALPIIIFVAKLATISQNDAWKSGKDFARYRQHKT